MARGLPLPEITSDQPITPIATKSLRDDALHALQRATSHFGLYI
jgi:hypothetical protein